MKARRRRCLAPKTLDGGRIGAADHRGKDLQRNRAVQLGLHGSVHDAHTALTQNAFDLVPLDPRLLLRRL